MDKMIPLDWEGMPLAVGRRTAVAGGEAMAQLGAAVAKARLDLAVCEKAATRWNEAVRVRRQVLQEAEEGLYMWVERGAELALGEDDS